MSPFIFLLFFWGTALTGVAVFGCLISRFTGSFLLFWGIVTCLIILVLGIDLSGSSPTLISGFREERDYQVGIDTEKCRGAGFCEEVCPRNCYALDKERYKVSLTHSGRCIRCGACIVQCPFDALYFVDENGRTISPEFVRKHKPGLSGKRK